MTGGYVYVQEFERKRDWHLAPTREMYRTLVISTERNRSRYHRSMVTAAPTMVDARRAAEELIAAGAGRVLLFGSLARGEQRGASDIDLVAVYDDLDYAERARRRCALERRARSATGFDVDVMVTDLPEWTVRTEQVPASVEARIAAESICLADSDRHGSIDWSKEVGLPDTPTAELEARYTDMSNALHRLTRWLPPTLEEQDAVRDADAETLRADEAVRFAAACAEVHMAVECAAKLIHVVHADTAPPHTHVISGLLAHERVPAPVVDEFECLAGTGVDLADLHLWRQGGAYTADRPLPAFDEHYLRLHVQASIRIVRFAAEQAGGVGLDDGIVTLLRRRLDRCEAVAAEPMRVAASPVSDG